MPDTENYWHLLFSGCYPEQQQDLNNKTIQTLNSLFKKCIVFLKGSARSSPDHMQRVFNPKTAISKKKEVKLTEKSFAATPFYMP